MSELPEYCNRTCIPTFQKQGKETPCEGCKNQRPELIEENYKAYFLYKKIQTQWHYAGMTGARTGLDYNALFKVAEIYDIDVDESIMAKIQAIEIEALRKQNEENKQKTS